MQHYVLYVGNHVKFPLDAITKKKGYFYPYFSSQLSYLLKNQPEKRCTVKSVSYLTSEIHSPFIYSSFFLYEPITHNTRKNAKYCEIAATQLALCNHLPTLF